jgi:hypothetical protein
MLAKPYAVSIEEKALAAGAVLRAPGKGPVFGPSGRNSQICPVSHANRCPGYLRFLNRRCHVAERLRIRIVPGDLRSRNSLRAARN